MNSTAEHRRLDAHRKRQANWKKWGPYLSERAWGTVREDYSPDGSAWEFFPHAHAALKAYRWGEDGLAGISDRYQYLCFAMALWNGNDPILKERLFGVTGSQGNHGEDVKEYYFYLDNTPTHSYMKMLYRYPQAEFPYRDLVEENQRRGFGDLEYELLDTGCFEENRYFDVWVEYAKAGQEDIFILITITNRGPEAAACHLLPTLWFRNTWSWGYAAGPMGDVLQKPNLKQTEGPAAVSAIEAVHPAIEPYFLYAEGAPRLLFTENETNTEKLYRSPNRTPYVKDAFHRFLVAGEVAAVNPALTGTKAAALYAVNLQPGQTRHIRLRLTANPQSLPFEDFNQTFERQRAEADAFYTAVQKADLSREEKQIQRQALAGMLWTKQFYDYNVEQWLEGDPTMPRPPEARKQGRNDEWEHLNNFDVISVPDKWEYPWYACWDLAFHCIPLALVDADFAKGQLELLAREWYMHPNGQLPAYEWNFSDVNPPVHAWAAWRVYKIDGQEQRARPDRPFLEGIFHKLLLNFTWWVNKKDSEGRNVFQGGFLGLDNISVFNRSEPLPTGGRINQSDGTAWMAFYCLVMLKIALELARENPVYQDSATKFFEHFLASRRDDRQLRRGRSLWDEQDGFFYDVLHLPETDRAPQSPVAGGPDSAARR